MFLDIRSEYGLSACELHMESNQFSAAFNLVDDENQALISTVRDQVKVLGVHLPYLDLNPISLNPATARMAIDIYLQSIRIAALVSADYAVFHARSAGTGLLARGRELEMWAGALKILAEAADRENLAFCMENADDIRLLDEVEGLVDSVPGIRMGLDIGHLFERERLTSPLARAAGRLCDNYLPAFRLTGRGVPFYQAKQWNKFLSERKEQLGCVHLHNYKDGRAHYPVSAGKIDMKRILPSIAAAGQIPVILEADYARFGIDWLHKDIAFIKEYLS